MSSLLKKLGFSSTRSLKDCPKHRRRQLSKALRLETLEDRKLLTTAVMDGDWFDPAVWNDGVPSAESRAIIGHGITVELDGTSHVAKEVVVHGNLVVPEDAATPDKMLEAGWVHVNSGGQFLVGIETDRYDQGSFTLLLTGTDKFADYVIETNMNGMMPGTMQVNNNDGFLMTGMGGRIQFLGEDKLSFTKLAATFTPSSEGSNNSIVVENVIERNFNEGAMNGDEFVTSAADDGALNWAVGDEIVIASSSYDYTEEEVREITGVQDNGDGTTTLTLNAALNYKHYGEIETYGEPGSEKQIDMRAEVALLSRNIKIKGLDSQDTDAEFGDRANAQFEPRQRADGLSDNEFAKLPENHVVNGVGGHIMIMPNSGQIIVDGVQLDGLGQASHKGRYPIHWHLGGNRGDREGQAGDVLRNSSITNSNNRGVTIHGTDNLRVEGVVLHDIHGHGFFFEDAVETGNQLIGNLVLGIHAVGGNDKSAADPGDKDPFVVDTHDSATESFARFSNSAAFWITNPDNTFIGNIAAGAGDSRDQAVYDYAKPGPAGTGFWYAIPRTAVGISSINDTTTRPIFAEFGQFDYNTSHTTAIGLNFDRGSDIEDAFFGDPSIVNSISNADNYEPRTDPNDPSTVTTNFVNGFTNYKASGAAMYHRGKVETIQFRNLATADSRNGPWSVSENRYEDSLIVGHSQGNSEPTIQVGGPRLYDGAGLFTGTHIAGFGAENAILFEVEGSSFGPTMYHSFRETTFQDDGSQSNFAHAVAQFQRDPNDPPGHKLGHPYQWIKGAMDLDGTLTGAIGGGVGFSIVPDVDFLVDSGDTLLPSGKAYLTNDIYARLRIQNKDDGVALFPDDDKSGKPLVRFTAQGAAGEEKRSVDVVAGQNINGDLYWTQIATKADSNNNGFVNETLVVEFMRKGLPAAGFVLNLDNQDGGRPGENPSIQDRVDNARLVTKFIGAGNYTPQLNFGTVVEVSSEAELRSATQPVVFFRDDVGNLYLNTFITNQPFIELVPGEPLQTHYPVELPTISYGTTIQAEEFDNGIDGIAYHDSDATNSQGTFRSDTGVDVTETHVTDLQNGEWLEYSASIVPAGYSIQVNYSASVDGGQIRVLAGESNSAGFLTELGIIDVKAAGSEIIERANMTFLEPNNAGVIRLEFIGDFAPDTTIDSISFDTPIQTAYKVHTISAVPATTLIQLEDFDNGGEGIAYHDTTPGNDTDGNQTRPDESVDEAGGLITNSIIAGEWLEYTVDIEPGIYSATLKKAWGTGRVKLSIAGDHSATRFAELGIFTPQTGGGEEITLNDLNLSGWAGSDRVLRVEMLDSFFGIDHLEFNYLRSSQQPYVARTITPESTTKVEFEHYDHGGQQIAYYDDSPGNARVDGNFRLDEDVDATSSLVTNEVFEGEWLEYTTDIAAGIYSITMRKAWGGSNTGIKLYAGDSNSASEAELALLGELVGDGEFLTLDNVDLTPWAGSNRVLRAEIVGNWMGLDYLEFTEFVPDQTPPTADIVDVSPDPRNTNAGIVTVNFDEDVTGVDISDFQLTRDGEVVDLAGVVLSQLSASQYTLDLSSVTDPDGSYELTLRGDGSGIADVAGNALAADATDQFFVDQTGPQVESVVINDGSAQRSMVRSLTVTFSEVVNGVDANSFVLMNTTTNTQVIPMVTTEDINGKTVATLTFSGIGIIGGSLADGNYVLTTLANGLTDAVGNQLDGNGDGTGGDDATDEFFRLFGDSNGDRRVNIVDLFAFRDAFIDSMFFNRHNDTFDFDGNGRVNIIDLFRFRSRYGKTV